jgi:hypothetical protein
VFRATIRCADEQGVRNNLPLRHIHSRSSTRLPSFEVRENAGEIERRVVMIEILSADSALAIVSAQLGLAIPVAPVDLSTWLAELMRKVCASYCPAPRQKLVRLARDCVGDLVLPVADLEAECDRALEGLFDAGDVVELSRIMSLDDRYSGDWIFLAPPSFARRGGDHIYVFGIAADDYPFLPLTLADALVRSGPYRFLHSPSDDALVLLRSHGLREVPATLVQRVPSQMTALAYLEVAKNKLAVALPAGEIDDVRICVRNAPRAYGYKDRWALPIDESGQFLCRRPSGFGAENWCFGEFEKGRLLRFVDLPWPSERVRACDAGWRLQLAIDCVDGCPSTYSIAEMDHTVSIRFSFPIPLWAQRRLRVEEDLRSISPFVRSVPKAEWREEKRIIEELLWFELEAPKKGHIDGTDN